jgi:hypothetical protein
VTKHEMHFICRVSFEGCPCRLTALHPLTVD